MIADGPDVVLARKLMMVVVVFLFTPFLRDMVVGTSLVGEVMLTIDKVLKSVFVFFALIVCLKRHMSVDSRALVFAVPLFGMMALSGFHLLVDKSVNDVFNVFAEKEFVGCVFFLVVFLLTSTMTFTISDYKFLFFVLSVYGLSLSLVSIWFSNYVDTTDLYRKVGDITRAGTGSTDPNMVNAVLNICSLFALVFVVLRMRWWCVFLFCFVFIQFGRLYTFSTGGFVSIVASLISVSLLMLKLKSDSFKRFLFLICLFVLPVSIYLLVNYADVFLYRILMKDDYVKEASIYSRIEQYQAATNIIINDPSMLIIGVGTARLPLVLGRGLSIHNSFIRPLFTGGLYSFFAFLFVYFWALRIVFISAFKSNSNEDKVFCIVVASSFIGWSIQAATLPYDMSVVTWFFFILSFALYKSFSAN